MLEYHEDYNHEGAIRVWSDRAWAVIARDGTILQTNKVSGYCKTAGLSDAELVEARSVIARMVDAPITGDVYIRFNDLPADGKSINWATGAKERGVSCYRATWDYIHGCYKRTGDGLDGAALLYLLQGAPVYLITGTEAGKGADGEPVLSGAKIMAQLTFDRTKNVYCIR